MSDRSESAAGGEPGTADAVDYQALLASTADVNVVETADGRYRYASPASLRLFGWRPADLEGRAVDDFVHPDDLATVRAARAELPEVEFASTRYRFRCRDGAYRWTEATSHLVRAHDTPLVVSTLRDITERQEHEADLELRARVDPLTGVANRTVLMDRIEQGLRRLDRAARGLAVLYLDLDRFKVVNDSLGHHVGDQILMSVAERVARHLRPTDTLARLGGDEFVVVADEMPTRQGAVELAERIVGAVRPGVPVDDEVVECTLSAGIAWTTDSGRGAAELLREADLALYRAKDRGRDRVEVFDEELRVTTASRLSTERMLRQAIDDGRVVVQYQPIIDLGTGQTVAAEALVRIGDADLGLVYPDAFLQVAEESGLLVEIDGLVLADAVAHLSAWRSRFADTGFREVAINVTARHLADTELPAALTELLDGAGVARGGLQVELTERTLMEASGTALTALHALREAGVGVGLDDFGAGYSPLSYLRRFPLDFVKIDRSLIHDLEIGPTERAIVGAIVGLAHALGLAVVAEGVETERQRQILEDLHCDRAQGFVLARPSGAGAVSELLATRTG